MNDAAPRVVAPQQAEQDAAESSVRPATLDEFIGQHQLRDNLQVFIEAAKTRGEALDHILFFGPPGLGKTTLAQIVAREMGVDFHATAGPVIQRAADLVAMLSKLAPREVLFIDEIHRLPPAAEEYLYPAMEDYQIDLIIGQGPGARSIRYRLAPFTLIGATTRSGLITRPLRERGLAEPGRTKEQDMVERLAAGLRRFDKDAQIVTQLMLTDEFVEGGRPDRAFRRI